MTISNVAVGKGGLLTKIDPRRHGNYGGGFDYINLISALAGNCPDVTFWWCSKIDLKEDGRRAAETYFPHGNVRFPPKVPTNTSARTTETGSESHIEQYSRWLNREGVTIDAGIFDPGIGARINIPNRTKKVTSPEQYATPPMIAYAMSAPVIHAINSFEKNPDFKWISVHFDPKCNMIQRDLDSDPIKSFAQYEYSYDTGRYRNGEFIDITYTNHYLPLESIAAFGRRVCSLHALESGKTIDFLIAMNGMYGGNGAQNRWPTVKACLEAIDDCQVYGDWKDEFVRENDRHWLTTGKFKGSVSRIELDEIMKSVKFTLLSPTGKGWVTAKFYECLIAGVLPLFGPDYDNQKHLDVPKTMRLSNLNTDTIKTAIERLRPVRLEILSHLRNKYLGQSTMNGRNLAFEIMNTLDPKFELGKIHPSLDCPFVDDFLDVVNKHSSGLDWIA